MLGTLSPEKERGNVLVEYVKKIARYSLPVFSDALFVVVPSDGSHKLVSILLDHESDELLMYSRFS